jgi:eukaryotic-like serine/threonine-protein kinase
MRHNTYNNGDIIGRYKIIKFIGAGSFGETYLVENIQSPGSNYLLKYLNPPNPASLEQARNKFDLEAQVLNDLNHPQIPTLYDKFQENQKDYLVEEYIKGHNLEEIAKNHIFIETEVIQILHDVLNILNYLFQKNIIHRDIKPANLIKRESDGKIFLIDYGTVKQVSTLNSTIMAGTAGYMPQEQIAGNPQFASDIYALGMTAIQLLTGENPINLSSSENEVICQNLTQFNPHLARILTKMVRRIPLARYSRANDVIADLEPLTFLNQTLIQRYKIINYLGGSGGFSHTYLAEDTLRKQRPCIVKQFNLNNNLHIAHEVEARLEVALPLLENFPHHEQISRFLDYVINNKKLYLIYSFIEGENLKDKIIQDKCWSEKEVTEFLKDVLQVLKFIHEQGIIHGDIKPSNLIQRQQDKKFVLIDFSEFKQIFTLEFNHRDNRIVVKPGGTNGYML